MRERDEGSAKVRVRGQGGRSAPAASDMGSAEGAKTGGAEEVKTEEEERALKGAALRESVIGTLVLHVEGEWEGGCETWEVKQLALEALLVGSYVSS